MTVGLQLGRPGVYEAPLRNDISLRPVRLDVGGFVGVALRGPVDRTTLVTSWSDYEIVFGGFESSDNAPDRLLPHALRAFFAQGGRRAYVVRVAPAPGFKGPTADEATAQFELAFQDEQRLVIAADNEGVWGNALSIEVTFDVQQTFTVRQLVADEFELPTGMRPPPFSLLRIRRAGLQAAGELRWLVERAGPAPFPGRSSLTARFEPELEVTTSPNPQDHLLTIDVVVATLEVSDSSSKLPRSERLTRLGLHNKHGRFISTAIAAESRLVKPVGEPPLTLLPDPLLSVIGTKTLVEGRDRNYGIDYSSFFDDGAAGDDVLDEQSHHRGVDLIGREPEIGLLCVPDLTWRAEPGIVQPAPARTFHKPTCCGECAAADPSIIYAPQVVVPVGLDARASDDLREIIRRQQRVVEVAVLRRRFIALLDVPNGLSVNQIQDWRSGFDSSFAASYHPWLGVPRPGDRQGGLVQVPPSVFAAGIIADRERTFGLPWGPANELAADAVLTLETVTDAVQDQLHLLGINIFRSERDGFRLTAARTLSSSDPDYRQLSVRRLMTMLELTIERQTQWLVFEPNNSQLRARLRHTIVQLLRDFQRRGAFAGDTDEQSYFVRCEDDVNPATSQAMGRLIAEIGVAPAAPLEYLILYIAHDVDGGLEVVSGGA